MKITEYTGERFIVEENSGRSSEGGFELECLP